MSSNNPIRIRLRYADIETFVEKFAPNVTRGGVFLASRHIQAVGSLVAFEIQLAGGEPVLAGEGRVTWVKPFDPAEPTRAYGMGVQFVSVQPATKANLARILRAKEASGQGRRPTTEPHRPVGTTAIGPYPARPTGSFQNGKPGVPPIDTSVDLAAEYGLDDHTVRRLIERTWMTGARTSDDLADLLKPEPAEPVTLAQALTELPRLLDPQYSRRRSSSGFRALEAGGAVAPAAAAAVGADGIVDKVSASETTDMTGERESGDDGVPDRPAASEITDMTAERQSQAALHAVSAAANGEPFVNGRGDRKRRR